MNSSHAGFWSSAHHGHDSRLRKAADDLPGRSWGRRRVRRMWRAQGPSSPQACVDGCIPAGCAAYSKKKKKKNWHARGYCSPSPGGRAALGVTSAGIFTVARSTGMRPVSRCRLDSSGRHLPAEGRQSVDSHPRLGGFAASSRAGDTCHDVGAAPRSFASASGLIWLPVRRRRGLPNRVSRRKSRRAWIGFRRKVLPVRADHPISGRLQAAPAAIILHLLRGPRSQRGDPSAVHTRSGF